MGPEDEHRWPPWLMPLLGTKFFVPCGFHADSYKSECNMYCLDCTNGALCSLCLAYHRDHQLIQIRRSSYHDVIRVNEIQKVLDIAGVQTYIINSARVVFLNERPQQRPGKGVTNTCEVCQRSLLDSFRFCSLGCKVVGTSVDYHSKTNKTMMMVKKKKKKEMNVARSSGSDSDGSLTSQSQDGVHGMSNSNNFMPPTVSHRSAKRRKGIPHRAPFGSLIVEY